MVAFISSDNCKQGVTGTTDLTGRTILKQAIVRYEWLTSLYDLRSGDRRKRIPQAGHRRADSHDAENQDWLVHGHHGMQG
jgi:hypothetical protein